MENKKYIRFKNMGQEDIFPISVLLSHPPEWFCPNYGRSLHLAMGQLPFKINIMPVSLTNVTLCCHLKISGLDFRVAMFASVLIRYGCLCWCLLKPSDPCYLYTSNYTVLIIYTFTPNYK